MKAKQQKAFSIITGRKSKSLLHLFFCIPISILICQVKARVLINLISCQGNLRAYAFCFWTNSAVSLCRYYSKPLEYMCICRSLLMVLPRILRLFRTPIYIGGNYNSRGVSLGLQLEVELNHLPFTHNSCVFVKSQVEGHGSVESIVYFVKW